MEQSPIGIEPTAPLAAAVPLVPSAQPTPKQLPLNKKRDRVLILLAGARNLGYPGDLFPDNDKTITGKVYHKARKALLRWIRDNRPEIHAAYLEERKLSPEQRTKRFESMQKPAMKLSVESMTLGSEVPPLSPPQDSSSPQL